jgi:hypothetical protein
VPSDQPQRRFANNFDHIAGIRRAHIHLQFQGEYFLATAHAPGELAYARNTAFRHGEKLRFHYLAGDHRVEALLQFVQLPTQPIREKNKRLRQAHMTDFVLLALGLEFRFAQGRAHLPLQRLAPGPGINHA